MDNCTTPLKRCPRCGNEYPATAENFGRNKKNSGGIGFYCKGCNARLAAEYRAKNPDKIKATMRRVYLQKRDSAIEYSRQQYAANREELCKRQRERYARNAEDQREKAKVRAARNRDQRRLNELKRESIKRSVEFNFTLEHQRIALDHFHGCCAVCGRQLYDLFNTHQLEWDHWIPMSKGGNTTPDNMIPLCGGRGGCNTRKHDTDPNEWLSRNYKPSQVKQTLARINAYFEWMKEQA